MTRQAFIQAQKRFGYRVVLPGSLALVAIVVLPFTWYAVQDARPDMTAVWRIAGNAVCVAALIAGVWFNYVHLSRVQQRIQHWCPHCKKGFGGTEDIVLKTGKCRYCGLQVIDDAA
jgi:hypothetical protein